MGRKYIRARKYIFFCTAILIVSSFFGCAALREMESRHNTRRSFINAERLLAEGNFNDALRENQRILSMFGNSSPGDEALFNMGLIYAQHDNPGRDYKKSRHYFTRLIKEFSESPLVYQAKIWESLFDVIDVIEKEKKVKKEETVKLEEKISDLKHLLASYEYLAEGDYKKALKENRKVLSRKGKSTLGDKALFNLGLIYAHHENPEKDFRKSVGFFKKLEKEYPKSPLLEQAKIWLGVLNVIEKSKQVDIEIEKKKKELAR